MELQQEAAAPDPHAAAELDQEFQQEWQDALAALEVLPNIHPVTGEVTDAENPLIKLGRVTELHVATERAAVSIYCRRHRCKRLLRANVAPSTLLIRRWFQASCQLWQLWSKDCYIAIATLVCTVHCSVKHSCAHPARAVWTLLPRARRRTLACAARSRRHVARLSHRVQVALHTPIRLFSKHPPASWP